MSNANSMIPGSSLRRERLRRGWSQVALAARAGCSLNTISLAERGGFLSSAMAEKVAHALGLSPADIRPGLDASRSPSGGVRP